MKLHHCFVKRKVMVVDQLLFAHFSVTLERLVLNYLEMKTSRTVILSYLRRYSIELLQITLIPIYFNIIFFVNTRFDDPYPAWTIVLLVSVLLMTIYGIVYILYWWRLSNRIARIVAMVLSYGIFSGIAYLITYRLLPDKGIWLYDKNRPFQTDEFMVNMAQLYMTCFFVAVGIVFIYWLRDYVRRKRQWEADLNNALLKFAMAQISPHAIYNTLNTLEEIMQDRFPEGAEVVVLMSEVMRYNTKYADRYREPVLLTEEIDQVRRMEKLYRFRFRDNLFLEVVVELEPNGFEIIPISVGTLLENAMKYGVSTDAANPIRLTFTTDGTHLLVICSNKKKSYKPTEQSTRIGLFNLEERLRLVYGAYAELRIEDDKINYTVTLRIPLRYTKRTSTIQR